MSALSHCSVGRHVALLGHVIFGLRANQSLLLLSSILLRLTMLSPKYNNLLLSDISCSMMHISEPIRNNS